MSTISRKVVKSMSNVKYSFSEDGAVGYGILADGTTFMFDAFMFDKIKDKNWYRQNKKQIANKIYIVDRNGDLIYWFLFGKKAGMEVDHINRNTLDNRIANLRFVTHQQNQCNQPEQCNNTSGATGVSFYPPRGKYRARIKIAQRDIHLGYFRTFEEAVMARNVGVECMFGEYGCYKETRRIPEWIRNKVVEKCAKFAHLSINKDFCVSYLSEVIAG